MYNGAMDKETLDFNQHIADLVADPANDCLGCGVQNLMMHKPRCPIFLEALAKDDPRFPGAKFLGVVENGEVLRYDRGDE